MGQTTSLPAPVVLPKPLPKGAVQEESDTKPVPYLLRILSTSWKRENTDELLGQLIELGQQDLLLLLHQILQLLKGLGHALDFQ